MSITVIPRPHDPGYADIELHDERRITWDLTIPEANKLAQQLRECAHAVGRFHHDGEGNLLCDACGALADADAVKCGMENEGVDLEDWYSHQRCGCVADQQDHTCGPSADVEERR